MFHFVQVVLQVNKINRHIYNQNKLAPIPQKQICSQIWSRSIWFLLIFWCLELLQVFPPFYVVSIRSWLQNSTKGETVIRFAKGSNEEGETNSRTCTSTRY